MASGKIVAINKAVIHRICSGQVVLDIATAVKELVENALDAKAKNIEVRLKEYGADLIEVADNGYGIDPSDYHAVTKKYHTSKLQEFTDLQELNTFGFRGEALSSLCALANVSIVTRQEGETVGARLEFDHQGSLRQTVSAARSPGTTVCIKDIFKPLPVRYKEFRRNLKKEYAKMVTVLQAYALIATEVRIICTNQAGNGGRVSVISTQGAASVRANVVTVFGSRTVEGLDAFEAPLDAPGEARISGLLSRGAAGMSRATGDRQFLYVNGRPVDLPKVNKMINETFKSLASHTLAHHKPMFVLDIKIPTQTYDVNVTPDKRKVFLQDEAKLLEGLQQALNETWEPSRSKFRVQAGSPLVSQTPGTDIKHVKKRRRLSDDETSTDEGITEDEGVEDKEKSVSPQEQLAPKELLSSEHAIEEELPADHSTPGSNNRLSGPAGLSSLQSSSALRSSSYRSSPLGEARRSSNQGDPMAWSSKPYHQCRTPSQPLITRFVGSIQPSAARRHTEQLTDKSDNNADPETQERSREEADPEDCVSAAEQLDSPSLANHMERGASEVHKENTPAKIRCEVPESRFKAGGAIEDMTNIQNVSEDADLREDLGDAQAGAAATADCMQEAAEVVQGGETPLQDICNLDREDSTGQHTSLRADFDIAKLTERWRHKLGRKDLGKEEGHQSRLVRPALQQGHEEGESSDDVKAAEAKLERIFEKSSFSDLTILGQFNMGFILARLDNDLFIIDQHASDEKYNFERLTKTTQLNRQPLLAPQSLDLTPSEAITVRENMHIFTQNGFEFKDSESGELLLSGVPYSRNQTFGRADVQELAQLLMDSHSTEQKKTVESTADTSQRASVNVSDRIPRPTRVRAMLAMRACRSSIMIGKSLDHSTMRQILTHLSQMDSPWNCPHGRPTMRHLAILPSPV